MNIMVITDDSVKNSLGVNIRERLLYNIERATSEFKHLSIKNEDINGCLGCFSCWDRTPGKCIIDDIGREIVSAYITCQYVVLVSPVKFGCYSTTIKKVLERNTPNNLPFLIKYQNRTRHKARYDSYPQLIAIGYGKDISEAEESTFTSIVNGNGINFQNKDSKVYICRQDEDIENISAQILEYLKYKGSTYK